MLAVFCPGLEGTGCQCEFSLSRHRLSSPSLDVNKQSQRLCWGWGKLSNWGLDLKTFKVPSIRESV